MSINESPVMYVKWGDIWSYDPQDQPDIDVNHIVCSLHNPTIAYCGHFDSIVEPINHDPLQNHENVCLQCVAILYNTPDFFCPVTKRPCICEHTNNQFEMDT